MMTMNIQLALTDVLVMWKFALPAMFLGCYFGVVLRTGKCFAFFSKVMKPMTVVGNLPEALGSFFILCLLNRYAANAMLADFGRNGTVSKNTLVAVYLMGALPTGIYFTLFTFSPVLISSLGWSLGTSFIAINLGMSALVTIIGFMWNRLLAKRHDASQTSALQESCYAVADKTDLLIAGKKAFQQFWNIAVVFMPVTLAFACLMHTEFIKTGIAALEPGLRWVNLTTGGVLVIIAGIPTLIAAIGVAGTLLQSGALAPRDVIFVLLLASFFHNVYDGLSRVLPTNLSIFGSKTGVTVTVIGTGIYLGVVAVGVSLAIWLKAI
ncbi:MAG: nucleoside recognition domain protein [Firmicutes bacterium]|nr:nucleoside recognition domain protein [Bacillota bacterium]